eukprot:Em0015g676a
MSDAAAIYTALIAGAAVLLVILLLSWLKKSTGKATEEKEREQNIEQESEEEKEKPQEGQERIKNKPLKKWKQTSGKKWTLPSHPWLAADFKGHTEAVVSLDFDSSGKYLASSSEDRTIRLWSMKDLNDKEHKYIRRSVELDHASHIKFSPDSTAVIGYLSNENKLQIYRISKPSQTGVNFTDIIEFPVLGVMDVISIGIASTGKFVMIGTTTAFQIWTTKGEVLATVETHQTPNTCAVVSHCGSFVACAGFTPDVKIWEVEFAKGGEFLKVSSAMQLKGHQASVLSVSFSSDSQRMASVSKDGSLKIWDINVRYKQREDPKQLRTASLPEQGPSIVAISPDGRVTVVAVNCSIYIYSSISGQIIQSLTEVHGGGITSLAWESASMYFASSGGLDRYIRIWNNVAGQKILVDELKDKLPKATSEALKRRMQQQIEETENRLKTFQQT